MNLEDIHEALELIKTEANGGDDERAHVLEKELWFEVLKHIAEDRGADLADFAREALKSKEIEFSRWFA
jgi:hypothetical protein